MSVVDWTAAGILAALCIAVLWAFGARRGSMVLLDACAAWGLIALPPLVGMLIGDSIGKWCGAAVSLAALWAADQSTLGLFNFVIAQWFGVRLARRLQIGRVTEDGIVLQIERFEAASAKHIELVRAAARKLGRIELPAGGGWCVTRWVWPLTGWWSRYRWIARSS